MAYLNDFASRFRKGLANPFTAAGRDWCVRCQQDVDVETEHAHHGTTYAYRRRCRRCGQVLARGMHDNVVTVVGSIADGWTQEAGKDQR